MFDTLEDIAFGVTISKPITVQDNNCAFKVVFSVHFKIPKGMKFIHNKFLGK